MGLQTVHTITIEFGYVPSPYGYKNEPITLSDLDNLNYGETDYILVKPEGVMLSYPLYSKESRICAFNNIRVRLEPWAKRHGYIVTEVDEERSGLFIPGTLIMHFHLNVPTYRVQRKKSDGEIVSTNVTANQLITILNSLKDPDILIF